MLYKIIWLFRGMIYKVLFGQFSMPSYIGRPIFLEGVRRVFIGRHVRIFPGARIQVLGKSSTLVIEDDVAIGQNFHVTSKGKLVIGRSTTVLGNVVITNIDHSYQSVGTHVLEQDHIVKETRIGENCFIGYGSVIQAGTILGDNCIIGANSVVRGTFPRQCVIVGSPGKVVKKYDDVSITWKVIK